MIADSSGLRVVFDQDTEEGTSRGVAVLVAIAMTNATSNISKVSSCVEEIRPSRTSEPRPEMTDLYRKKAELQNEFIDSIAPMFSKKL
jgi:sugar (pentulose or hexulose) kinase